VLDARYEQLRHAALHARGTAFPLGLGVLTGHRWVFDQSACAIYDLIAAVPWEERDE